MERLINTCSCCIRAWFFFFGGNEYSIEIPDDDFYIISEPNDNRSHRGNPLDVLTICPGNGKYFNDCSLDELSTLASSFDKKCIKFLQKSGIIQEKIVDKTKML